MPSHPLTNFEMQSYYQNKPNSKVFVYLQNNLPNTKMDAAYVVNLDNCKSIGMHWTALYVNGDSDTYFDSFGAEHIPEEISRFIDNKNIIMIYDSIMCGHF